LAQVSFFRFSLSSVASSDVVMMVRLIGLSFSLAFADPVLPFSADNSSSPDGVETSMPEAVCSNYAIGVGKRFKGTTLARRKTKDSSKCCALCTKKKMCVGWVWRKKNKKCVLRSHITSVVQEKGATSAVDLDDALDACPVTHRYRSDPTSNGELGAKTCWRSWKTAASGNPRTCKDWCALPHHVGDARLQGFLKRCPTSVCGIPTKTECPVKFPFLAGSPGYYKQLTDKACWTSRSMATRGYGTCDDYCILPQHKGEAALNTFFKSCKWKNICKAKLQPSCNANAKRKDCGFHGIKEDSCLDKGCCWKLPMANTTALASEANPICFYPTTSDADLDDVIV